MACKIEIKENLEREIAKKAEGLDAAYWPIAQQKAKEINKSYTFNVVKVFEGENDHDNKVVITVPPELVDSYHAYFTSLEEKEARGVQIEDANRAGEEYDDEYMFQDEEVPVSRASEATIAKVKEAIKKMGINLQSLEDYIKGNPDINTKGVTGLADLIRGIIAIAHGKENVALTEEMVHVATAILEQINPQMVTQMIGKIGNFKIYQQVFDVYSKKKDYQTSDGKPNIRKIKKEAVDKLIAELIIRQSEGSTEFPELLQENNRTNIRSWWQKILDWFRSLYKKSDIDIFEEAAQKIISGEVQGEIKGEGVFFQVKNDIVDQFYNKYLDYDKRLDLVPEDTVNKVDRHYTLDGEGMIPTVTQKVKGKQRMPERTKTQQKRDDQARDWGIAGHAFIQNDMLVNLIDKDGYARETPLDNAIDTVLSTEIQNKLKAFNRELIKSFRPGTRFLVETKVVNIRDKKKLASTVDFKAIEPTEDGKDVKIHTLDWKFMGIDKKRDEDVPWYKQKEWVPQMGEYTRMDYDTYGAKRGQIGMARMIPFQLNYQYLVPSDPNSALYPGSIEIGNLDPKKEPKLYLLPVPTDVESTGNTEVDKLVGSLNSYYNKLSKKRVSPDEKYIKRAQLQELSKAIRSLRMQLNFAPLVNVGVTFLKNAQKSLDTFKGLDYSTLTEKDIRTKLEELLELKVSAEKFANIDKVFLSYFPKEGLDEKAKKIFNGQGGNPGLDKIASSTERMINEISELQKEYVVHLALKMEVTTEAYKERVLAPEKEVKGMFKTLSELSRIPSKIVNIAANLVLNARSLINIEMGRLMRDLTDVLLPLENLARAEGKSAFDYIGTVVNGELRLIQKIDKSFWEELSKAKLAKNRQFLLDNLNIEEYNKLKDEALKKGEELINNTIYSTEEADNEKRREFELKSLKNRLDIESKNFDGYTHPQFAYLFNKTMRADLHYSQEYRQLMANDKAFTVWKFFSSLNERGIRNGYLSHKGMSFFAMVEASMLQRLSVTNNMIKESGDIFNDLYTVRINEQQDYGKIDKETGLPKREIPRLFTKTDKEVHQLSRDLTKVGTLWIRSLLEYESARQMEVTLKTLEEVERSKGHLIVDERNRPIEENGEFKVDKSSNKNAEIVQNIIDDNIYRLRQDLGSIGRSTLSFVAEKTSKDQETANKRTLSLEKGLNSMNILTQALAVGLKASIMVPNYFGQHFQSFINNGGMYKYGEYYKNHIRLIAGRLSTVEKGLIDMFVPLNGDTSIEERRKLALKQGYIKWLGTWTVQDFMQSTNYLPERHLQFTNADSLIQNAIVIDGKIVNVRQYLKDKERVKYSMTESERKTFEKGFEDRVKQLKETNSLMNIAKIQDDKIVIPGVNDEELAKFRTTIVEWGRNLNGQMSQENKAGYRRDVLLSSFAMFRNWIPKQVSVRAHDIQYNLETHDWEYGRTRAFVKAYIQACNGNISKMIDIMNGTDKGLAIMDEMLERKREDYKKKFGVELEITNEEFYDMMRRALSNEMKELGTLLSLLTIMLAAKAAAPPEDEDALTRNKYKFFAKLIIKSVDEVRFYYDPTSFLSMTRGSFLPALGTVTKVQRGLNALVKETYGYATDDEELINKTHPAKYFMDVIPVISQFNREILPIIDADLAKELGIRVTAEPRIRQ